MSERMRCVKCDRQLELQKVVFEYLGLTMNREVPRCPKCGQVFISAELAEGKIKEVEISLEDK
jgi:NAD-dependent SIR2 family protein deacetylase